MEKPSYTAPALQRGLQILEYLADTREPQKLSAISAVLGLSVSSIQRMVNQLKQEGYILRTPNGGYYLSNKLYRVAHDHESEGSLLQAAMPAMHDFVLRTGESIHLSVAVIDQFVVIGQLAGTQLIRITIRPGSYPIDQFPSGQVMLVFKAHGTDLYQLEELPRDTRNFIAENRYAYDQSQCAHGIYHLAVPILLENGHCTGALATSFVLPADDDPSTPRRLEELVSSLHAAAAATAARIG